MKQFLVATLLLAMVCSTASAQEGAPPGGAPPGGGQGGADPEQLLAQAEKLYEALEYEASLKILIAVQQAPGATPMQRARAFLYMGVCFTALGNAENAVASFMELLKLKPSFRLPPGISPSIQAMFKEALKRAKLPETPPPEGKGGGAEGPGGEGKESGVNVEATVAGTPRTGRAVDINIDLDDPQGQVQEVVLHWRLVGGADFSSIKVQHKQGQKKLRGRIPGAMLGDKAGRLQFTVEALGQGGLALAHAGSESSPLEADLQAGSKAGSHWGWYVLGIGGGAAVVGGIVAAILLSRASDNPMNNAAHVSVTIR